MFDRQALSLNTFKSWIDKFYVSNNNLNAENLKQSFLTLIDLLEYDDSNWCMIRKSEPSAFWTNVIATYPVSKPLEKLIHGILVIPFGSADSER